RVRNTNALFEGEFRMLSGDGRDRWVLAKGGTVNLPESRGPRRMGALLDITERKKMEGQLRESEENLRRLLETTAAVIWQADMASWQFTYVSPQGVKLLGYPLEQWYEKDFWPSHIHPDDRQLAIDTCLKMSRNAEDFDFEYRMVRSSGEVVWVHDIVNCHNEDGEPLQLRGLMLDVTELKRGEEALEKERAFLRQVIDIDPNFIFAKDRAGRFTLANRAVADAYGTTVENLIGKTDADFNPNRDEVESFHRMDLEVIDSLQERFIPEETITDAGGKTRWLQTVKRPIVGPNGSADQVLGASTDITARKMAEAELQRNRDELGHMTRVSTLGELVASLAHELNQPLGAILSNAEAAEMLLKAEPPPLDEVGEILADIRSDDRRASDVIRGLRGLLRRQDVARESLQINDAVGDVLRLLNIDAVHRKVALRFEPAENLPPVRGDRVQLQQVVLNLVLNAMEAMAGQAEETRQVVVRSGPGDDGMIKISVSDSGPGIPSDKLPKLFEPFFTTKMEGMGMGLSIARTIVEAHHGRIWAENNCGGGAIFYFILPVATEA
ncbi:MAG TPA: PAS domain S-box protein, partial [Candidatus Binatia bacterium]